MKEDIVAGLPLNSLVTKSQEGKWVAISSDHKKLIAESDDLLALEKKIIGKDVIVFKVMRSDVGYAPELGAIQSL